MKWPFVQSANRATSRSGLPDSILVITDPDVQYAGSPVNGGVLRMMRAPGDPLDFNPAAFQQDYQVTICHLDPLLRPDDQTLEPRPWLATDWKQNATGTEIVYTLRDDVQWSDGSALTAEDVAFSLDVYANDLNSAVRNFFSTYEQAEAVDRTTVHVRLTENDPTWLFNASTLPVFQRAQYLAFWNRQQPGLATLSGFDWNQQPPVGSGPWLVDKFSAESLTLKANRSYWQEPARLSQLEITWESSVARQLAAWQAKDIDICIAPRASDFDLLGDRPGRLYATRGPGVMFAAFNFTNLSTPIAGVFDDLRVRQALSLLIDRRGYAASVFAGFIDETAQTTVAQPWAHDADLAAPRQDRDQALALLNDAGWADFNGDGWIERATDGAPLILSMIAPVDGSPELLQVLGRLQQDFLAAGVNLQLQFIPADAFQQRWTVTRDYDLIAFRYDCYPGFTDFDLYGSNWDLRRNALGWNPGGYANADADAAIDDYLAATTLRDQQTALTALQQAVVDDLFGLWLGYPNTTVLIADDILGHQPSVFWPLANTRLLWRVVSPSAE